jgi:D-alanine-D-alanine ligase
MSKFKISVLMGGPSLEHSVSLVSGTGVVKALDLEKYEIHPVVIDPKGIWIWSQTALSQVEQQEFDPNQWIQNPDLERHTYPSAAQLPAKDIAFLALHGSFGEDGRVQAWLEMGGVPYTGSGVLGSALALHKIQTKRIYESAQIPTAPWAVLRRGDTIESWVAGQTLQFPWFCKDPLGGSSIAMGCAKNPTEAVELLQRLSENASEVLVEEGVQGVEVSCGWIPGQAPCPATEIRVEGFFDFEAKYQGKSREITPAEISTEQMQSVQDLAKKCHEALGLDVYSRTDVILTPQGPIVLETNTLPGLTPTSLLPQQAACLGLDYRQLLEVIIQSSLEVRGGSAL